MTVWKGKTVAGCYLWAEADIALRVYCSEETVRLCSLKNSPLEIGMIFKLKDFANFHFSRDE